MQSIHFLQYARNHARFLRAAGRLYRVLSARTERGVSVLHPASSDLTLTLVPGQGMCCAMQLGYLGIPIVRQ